jgi:hypothetical protein
MLQYFMDHHVHAAITPGLRSRSIACLTFHEDGAGPLPPADLEGVLAGMIRDELNRQDKGGPVTQSSYNAPEAKTQRFGDYVFLEANCAVFG